MPLTLFSLLAAALLAAAYSQTTTTFSNCDRTFSCGAIRNISYPFVGGARPSHCGLPDLALTCRSNNVTVLTHNSLNYRVLLLDQAQKRLVLSRTDLYHTSCPSRFRNSTLKSTLLSSDAPRNEELTLFYGCNAPTSMTRRPHNLFNCSSSSFNFSDAYYLVGPVPRDPILRFIHCNVSISLLVLSEVGDRLANSRLSLGRALKQGFSVNYSVPEERLCSECYRLGGQCGYDSVLSELVCACGDRPCPFALTLPPEASPSPQVANSGGSNIGRSIGLPIGGAVLAGIGLGWLIFYFRQKRKQRLQLLATGSTQTASKDSLTPLSSKDPSTPPSTKFVKSIPSYPSSNSDFGRDSTYFGVQVFNYSELEEATNNFDPSKALGEGGFGTVYYGVLADGRVVAVKRLYENNFKRVEQFMNEVEILTQVRHANLVALFGCTSKRSRELLLVYEYIPNGTVADHLHGKRAASGLLSWPVRLNIAIETAEALAYLHKSEIIHRDVKTNNILLDNDFHVKVADFGLSRLFPLDATHVSTAPQGTPGYVDPEYYQCYQLTEKSDVYSFGVVLIELISSLQAVDTNRHRHDINLANMAVNNIQNHTLHELVDSSIGFETNTTVRRMATLVAELAFRCLQQVKDMRPSMEEVLEALKSIKNEDFNAHKVEIVDILVDDETGLLKSSVAPPSPDSVAASGSTPNSSA
ncbi:LEAF RUST 10 DISEASE-RESISTANCE LOCUS RECEPTOR-LIKE PROTEIN KINASE-like 1.4 isoform X4 [Salvia divinorum]|uniref:non-specific serine/threonine protein kinase n=1 Tax=Salvia divinorum TaxID=28513 RepID=A0ABD1G1I7_SALDI